jgi:hypothetical protein
VTAEAAHVFRRSPRFVGREVGGEYILVPLARGRGDLDSVFNLSRVGAFIWERLDGRESGAELARAIAAHFEVDEGRAERDYLDFVSELERLGAVERAAER